MSNIIFFIASTGGESTPETEEELTEVPESDILP